MSATVPAARSRRAESARLELMQAAAESIATRGFHGMSMRKLAAANGRSLGNFYNHFSSKEAMLFAIQEEAFEALIGEAEVTLAELERPNARFYAFVLRHVHYVAEHPSIMRVLVHEAAALPPRERARVRQLKERYFDLGRGLVAALMGARGLELGPLELERATYNVFGMLNWLYGWYRPEQHGQPAEAAASIYDMVLCGLGCECGAAAERDAADHHLAAREAGPLLGARPAAEGEDEVREGTEEHREIEA